MRISRQRHFPIYMALRTISPLAGRGICRMLCDDAVRVLASDVAGRIGRIDCLLLDSQLGQISGIEVRPQPKASHSAIPVIFMTAHEDETLYQQALEVGFAAYLRKPLSAHQLLDAIEIARSE